MTVYLPYYVGRGCKGFATEKGRIDIILEFPIALKRLPEINATDVELFISAIQARQIELSTVNRYHTRLQAVFSFAVSSGYIDKNPCRGIKKFKEFCRKRALSGKEIRKLLDSCALSKSPDMADAVKIALNTGMRKREILTLNARNIDFKNSIIVLKGVKTKSGYDREVPLNDDAVAVLKKRMKKRSTDRLFSVKSVKTAFNTAVRRAGIEAVRFHDLRRTCATHLRDAGIDITIICEILGHSSVKVTERYLYNSRKTLLDSIKKIGFK
jgi:integrase